MDLRVLNKNFELIAIIDYYQSLMWCKRYNKVGAFDLQIIANKETLSLLKMGNYIARDDDESVYKIEAIEIDTSSDNNNYMIVGGSEIKNILHQRIVYETEKYSNKTVEDVMRGLVTNNVISPTNEKRKINNFYLKDKKNYQDKITTQITFTNVGEKIESLCKTYGYGYKVFLENGKIYFDVFKGVNRTLTQNENPRVIFSYGYDNLFSSKYKTDESKIKNVALIGGEGEGSARKKAEVGDEEGLNRFEMFVDANGISTENGTIDDGVYETLLIEKGKEELAKIEDKTSVEGIVDASVYEYKKDFDLGDIVVIETEFGIRINARIDEIIETWDTSGYTLEPKFDYIDLETYLTDENRNILITENGDELLYEGVIS